MNLLDFICFLGIYSEILELSNLKNIFRDSTLRKFEKQSQMQSNNGRIQRRTDAGSLSFPLTFIFAVSDALGRRSIGRFISIQARVLDNAAHGSVQNLFGLSILHCGYWAGAVVFLLCTSTSIPFCIRPILPEYSKSFYHLVSGNLISLPYVLKIWKYCKCWTILFIG